LAFWGRGQRALSHQLGFYGRAVSVSLPSGVRGPENFEFDALGLENRIRV